MLVLLLIKGLGIFLSFFQLVVIIEYLGLNIAGQYLIFVSFAVILRLLSTLGCEFYVNKESAKLNLDNKKYKISPNIMKVWIYANTVNLSLIFAAIIIYYTSYLPSEPYFLSFIMMILSSFFAGNVFFFSEILKTTKKRKISIFMSDVFFSLVFIISLIIIKPENLIYLTSIYLFSIIVVFVTSVFVLLRFYRLSFPSNLMLHRKDINSLSSHFVSICTSQISIKWLPQIVISNFVNLQFIPFFILVQRLGILYRAIQQSVEVKYLRNYIKSLDESRNREFFKLYQLTAFRSSLLSIAITIGIYFFSNYILNLFNLDNMGLDNLLILASICYSLMLVAGPSRRMLHLLQQHRTYILLSISISILFLLNLVFASYYFDYAGSVIVFLIFYSLQNFIYLFFGLRQFKKR